MQKCLKKGHQQNEDGSERRDAVTIQSTYPSKYIYTMLIFFLPFSPIRVCALTCTQTLSPIHSQIIYSVDSRANKWRISVDLFTFQHPFRLRTQGASLIWCRMKEPKLQCTNWLYHADVEFMLAPGQRKAFCQNLNSITMVLGHFWGFRSW